MSDNVVAVALLIDSSLTLSTQWSGVLKLYINPLVQRLLTGKDSNLFHIGLITYGTSDSYPTPILTKRYLAHPQFIYKDLREDSHKLGLGMTSSGGKIGMAALEGYAATIEMFDFFSRTLQEEMGDKPLSESGARFHIVHIFHGVPDESRHPLWNQSSELDTLSWKTMPDELKKRDINLNIIGLRQSSVLSELHSQMVAEPCQPWFNVHPGHTILLSSSASWSPAPASKRPPEETPPEASEDTKRPRVSSPVKPHPSPKPSTPQPVAQPASTSSNGPPTSEPAAKQPVPASAPIPAAAAPAPAPVPPTAPASAPGPAMPNMPQLPPIIQIIQRTRQMEVQLKKHAEDMKAALQAGRTQEVEEIKNVFMPKKATYEKLKQLTMQLTRAQAASRGGAAPGMPNVQGPMPSDLVNAGGPGNLTQPDGNAIAGPSNVVPSNQLVPQQPVPGNAGMPTGAAPVQDRQAIAQAVQDRFSRPIEKPPMLAQNSGVTPNLPPNVTQQMALQYQKLLEQQRNSGVQQPLLPPAAPGNQTTFPNASQQQQQSRNMWMGRIEWSGSDQITLARKEVYAEVTARGQGGIDIRAELWPPVLTLSPSKDPAVQLPELKNWVVQHKPIVCTFIATARTLSQQVNESNFRSLVNLLNEKKVYAIASWHLPAKNAKGEALLMFPGQRGELGGACFPESGIPVYPKPLNPNPQMPGNMGAGMAPNLMVPSSFNPTQQQQILAMRLAALKAQNGGTLPVHLMNMANNLANANMGNMGNNNNNMNNNNMGGGGAWGMDPNANNNMMNQLGGGGPPMNLVGGSNAPSLAQGFQMQGAMQQPNLNLNANLMQQLQQQQQQHGQMPQGTPSLEMLQSLFQKR